MTELPRPATPPLPAPPGAFEQVRRRARRRRGARLGALAFAALMPVAAVAAVTVPGDGRDTVSPAGTPECGGATPETQSPSPSPSPTTAAPNLSATRTAPGSVPVRDEAPPQPPTVPPDAPPMTGTVRAADGAPLRCVGIYLTDPTQTLRLVARTDRDGRFSAPCRYGRAAALAFDPYGTYDAVAGEHGWVMFDNPAAPERPCAEPVDVRMRPPSGVTIRVTGDPSRAAGVTELHLRCGDLDEWSGLTLLVLRRDADGLFRAGGLGPCLYEITGDGIDGELRELGEGERAEWEVPVG
jgi:hypothetical protein